MTNLSININKVATLRNARGENMPDVAKFATNCEAYGAQGITVHPRPDERHIRRSDLFDLKNVITTEFNIEGYPSEEFMNLVLTVKPEQVTLVPDKPGQLTSDHGWNVNENMELLTDVVERLQQAGIRASIFVDPDTETIRTAAKTGADRVELYTKAYADNYAKDPESAIAPYVRASEAAHAVGLGVNAGHDLNLANLRFFHERLPYLDEVSIGHAVICDALYLGIAEAIRQYRDCLQPKN